MLCLANVMGFMVDEFVKILYSMGDELIHSTHKLTARTKFKTNIYADKKTGDNNGQVRRLQH